MTCLYSEPPIFFFSFFPSLWPCFTTSSKSSSSTCEMQCCLCNGMSLYLRSCPTPGDPATSRDPLSRGRIFDTQPAEGSSSIGLSFSASYLASIVLQTYSMHLFCTKYYASRSISHVVINMTSITSLLTAN